MIPTKFGWSLRTSSGEEDENVKRLHIDEDGQKAVAMAHLAFGSDELKMGILFNSLIVI